MSTQIPRSEPLVVTAGDRVQWLKTLSDFPADAWTLTYHVVSGTDKFEIVASDDGSGKHLVDEAGTVSSTWPTGTLRYQGVVDDGAGDRRTVVRGQFEVQPNFAAQTGGYDGRTEAQKYLDFLYSAREAMSTGAATVASYSIGNRTRTFRSLEQLQEAIANARLEVKREEDAQRISKGLGTTMTIRSRF